MSEGLNVDLGKEVDFEIKLDEGKVKLTFGADTKGVDAGVYVDLDPAYFLDKLADAIPGEVDDAVFEALKGMLKVV